MKKIVLKVGGSLLFDKDLAVRKESILKFTEIIKKAKNIKAVIVGGGKIARTYISAAREFNAGESLGDTFGIKVSRLNAMLLINALGDAAYPEPIESIKEARINSLWDKIFIAGGFVPGQSTTSVAFQIAESIKATNLIILTDVDGIYDKDPNKYEDAKRFSSMTIAELEKVIFGAADSNGKSQSAAGEYRIFDAVSMQIMKRNSIDVMLTHGEKWENLEKLLVDEDFANAVGTKILK